MTILFRLLFFIALLYFGFLAGVFAAIEESYFYRKILHAYKYGEAMSELQAMEALKINTNLWEQTDDPSRQGVMLVKPDGVMPGARLVAHNRTEAVLMTVDGKELYRWSMPLHAIPGQEKWKDEAGYINWRYVHLLEGGELLVVYENAFTTPYGLGIVKLDKDSNVLWYYDGHTHHHLSVAEDGSIYALEQQIQDVVPEGYPDIITPFYDEYVIHLSPDGKLLERVSIMEAVLNSDHAYLVKYMRYMKHKRDEDFMHPNKAEVLSAAQAAALPDAKPEDVLISIREVDAIAVLDMQNKRLRWAMQGAWYHQHDPDVLPDGTIMLFDNQGLSAVNDTVERSRIVTVDPATSQILWQYPTSDDVPFYSMIRGGQEQLPNGNILITESSAGRAIEITADGEVVWEYLSPELQQVEANSYRGVLMEVQYVANDRMGFLKSD